MTTKVSQGLLQHPYKRNVIINGNMDIWQRGTSFAAIASGEYSADRFAYHYVGIGAYTAFQSGIVPTYGASGTKSNYSLTLDCTTADTSIVAGDHYSLAYPIEGYDYARIAGGDATLSFWVMGAKTGIHCVSFRNTGTDRSYIAEYTIALANTWQKVEITIPLTETAGTWDYTNGVGLYISFILATGTTFHTTKDAWQVGNYLGTSGQVNELDNVANNFRIAQVQFEKGDTATPLEYVSFADEVTRCERYFQKSYNLTDAPGTIQNRGTIWEPITRNVATLSGGVTFRTTMRDGTPTIVIYSPTSGTAGKCENNGDKTSTGLQAGSTGIGYITVTSGTVAVHCYWHYTADAEF